MIASMEPITIHYDVPGISSGGRLLDEIVLQPTTTTNGVAVVADPAGPVSEQTRETLTRAAQRIAQGLGLHARSLTVRCTTHIGHHAKTGHDCSYEGDAILDVMLDRQWAFNLWSTLLRADDLLSGRFPSMHASARVPWIDALWSLSVEDRLATRGVVRRSSRQERTATTANADHLARHEFLAALMWAGKQRGLSLLRAEAENIARLIGGKNVSLHEIIPLGEKFGFRREGPLASIPLPEFWPRRHSDALGPRRVHNAEKRAVASSLP